MFRPILQPSSSYYSALSIKIFYTICSRLVDDEISFILNCIWLNELSSILYKVSIKSFPDYKHLLQEIYVKYIFFNIT